LIGGFVLALGLAYAVGRGVQAVQAPEEPVVCPEMPLKQRLDGHIVGLAHVQITKIGARMIGSVRGPQSIGPDPLERLTVVQGDRMYRIRRFERLSLGVRSPGSSGFDLTIPGTSLRLESPVLFVTSACIPDHPVKLRVWELGPASHLMPAQHEEVRLRDYLREQLPGEAAAIAAAAPRIVGELATNVPGCARAAVLGDGRADDDRFTALVCLGFGGVVERTLFGPVRGSGIDELAALDIDGDGIDELIAVHREQAIAGNYTHRSVLIHHDAATDELAAIELGPTGP
jgi:hypothetical protein